MKKTAERPAQSANRVRLKDHRGYREAAALLDQLDSAIKITTEDLAQLMFRSARLSTEARHWLNRVPALCSIPDELRDSLARSIASAGSVSPATLARLQPFRLVPSFADSLDTEMAVQISDHSASLELLKHAAAFQRCEVLKQKNLAMAEVRDRLQGEREHTARAVAGALVELAAALRDEYRFTELLRSEDDEFPAMLRPGPFPMPLPSDSAIVRWVAEVLGVPESEALALIAGANPGKALHASAEV